MRHFKAAPVVLISLLVLCTGVSAQKIYKCGNSYSQQSCTNGVIIDGALRPTATDKNAQDQATRRDTLTADRMEKSRIQQERKDLAANSVTAARQSQALSTPDETSTSRVKRKVNKKVEEFKAVVPGTESTKKRSKK